MVYKTLYRKLKIVQHEPHNKAVVNSYAPEGKQFLLQTNSSLHRII
jgi:hypothetical protein